MKMVSVIIACAAWLALPASAQTQSPPATGGNAMRGKDAAPRIERLRFKRRAL